MLTLELFEIKNTHTPLFKFFFYMFCFSLVEEEEEKILFLRKSRWISKVMLQNKMKKSNLLKWFFDVNSLKKKHIKKTTPIY
jgi:hypothetical protein